MNKQLKKTIFSTEILFFGGLGVFCLLLSIFRVWMSGTSFYLFLNWNLFLAYIPWFLLLGLSSFQNLKNKKALVGVVLLTWLVFFPNAPYILTDLFHLRMRSSVPIWYDLIMILFFAWVGLLVGFVSLWRVEKILSQFMGSKSRSMLITFMLFLSAFGVYLGRFLRWNTWDIVNNPHTLFVDITDRFLHPMTHPRTWGMTIFMGVLLCVFYWSFRLVRTKQLFS